MTNILLHLLVSILWLQAVIIRFAHVSNKLTCNTKESRTHTGKERNILLSAVCVLRKRASSSHKSAIKLLMELTTY